LRCRALRCAALQINFPGMKRNCPIYNH
jgi:hypothetical protein